MVERFKPSKQPSLFQRWQMVGRILMTGHLFFFFGVSSAQRLWCDFMSGGDPGRTNGIRERSLRQPGFRTVSVSVWGEGDGRGRVGGGGTINALKPHGPGRLMCHPVKAVNVLFSAPSGSGAARGHRRTMEQKEEVKWRQDGKRQGSGRVPRGSRAFRLTWRHWLCQHLIEGACGRA